METPLILRVRAAIESLGWSQDAVAAAIHSTADKLSKSLSGKRRFTTLELALLADLTGRTIDWFINGKEAEIPLLAARSVGVIAPSSSKILEIAEKMNSADQQLQVLNGSRELVSLPDLVYPVEIAAWATEHAGDELYLLPNSELMETITQKFDTDILVTQLPNIDGFSWQTSSFRLIGVTTTPRWARQRFTLAHELGHILMRHSQELIEDKIDYDTNYDTERAANLFAAEFLMPKDAITSAVTEEPISYNDFNRLVNRFHVSPIALAWRLFDLGLLSAEERAKYSNQRARSAVLFSGMKNYHQQAQTDALVTRLPARLVYEHSAAYEEGRTSARPLAELLGVDSQEIIDQYALPLGA